MSAAADDPAKAAARCSAGEWRIAANGQESGSIERGVIAEVRTDAFLAAHGGSKLDHSGMVKALELLANHEIGQKPKK